METIASAHCGSQGLAGLSKSHRPTLTLTAAPGRGSHRGNRFGWSVEGVPSLAVVTRNSGTKPTAIILCTALSIFCCRERSAAVTGEEALEDDALDGGDDPAPRDADTGECRADDLQLVRFDIDVSRTFHLVQEPA